jgi:nitroreductase
MSSIISSIHCRVSVRTYDPAGLSVEQKNAVKKICESNTVGPFGYRCRLELVDLSEAERAELRRFGTYGFIRGTRLFIAGVITPAANALLDFGYCFEKTVLELTSLGFGTCWMALTFNKPGFSNKADLRENEALVIVSPVGVPSKKKSLLETFVKAATGPRNKKPWQDIFFAGDGSRPLTKAAAGAYAEALECVRLAPSAANYQPWHIVKAPDADTFHFFMKQKGKTTRGELHAGIAMCHFGLAAQELGLRGAWKVVDGMQNAGADYFVSWVSR